MVPLSIEHDPREFDAQMKLVCDRYHPMDIESLAKLLESGENPPRGSVVISFDDGYRNNFEFAAPILNKYDILAAFYVITESVKQQVAPWFCETYHVFLSTNIPSWRVPGSVECVSLETREDRDKSRRLFNKCVVSMAAEERRAAIGKLYSDLEVIPHAGSHELMMTWEMLRRLQQDGHTIGSHSFSHPNLTQIGDSDLLREISESKLAIMENTRSSARHFSYPNPIIQPHWTLDVAKALNDAGYTTGVTSGNGTVDKRSNLLVLPRVSAPATVAALRWRLDCLFAGVTD